MSIFKSLFSPTRRNLVRWRYTALFFLGLQVCWLADNTLAAVALVFGWVYGMEWQRVKTADGLLMRGNDENKAK